MESRDRSKDFEPLLPFNDLLSSSVKDGSDAGPACNSSTNGDGNEINEHAPPSIGRQFTAENLDLFSKETLALFKELESLCAYYKLNECVELVHKIRAAVNKELDKCFMHIEENYEANFKNTICQPPSDLATPPAGHAQVQLELGDLQTTLSPYVIDVENEALRQKRNSLFEQCPKEWPTLIKLKVVQDITTHRDSIPTPLPRRLTVKEALSSITGLFAESLAALLSCEVVRIYLYDVNRNLHCCATFPFHATQGDPMRATYEEIMLVKDLHQTICGKCIAVNGREATNAALKDDDMARIRQEMASSGLGSIRSCLIFPILSSEHPNSSVGMIHCVNKNCAPPVDSKKGINFTTDDELLLSMTSRLFGCVLTRYPVNYFSLRVGETIRKAVFPRGGEEVGPNAHLRVGLLQDSFVEDASGVASRAMTSTEQIKILRASVNSIYQTSTHRQRLRRMGDLGNLDTTLSSVEFNLNVMSELWKAGITENVAMHQQYRELEGELKKTKLLLENVLDGLSSIRTFRNAEVMAQHIQMLELYARSESIDILTEFIHNMICEEAVRESVDLQNSVFSSTPEFRSKGNSPEESSKMSSDTKPPKTLDSSPFLTETELGELRRHQERLNAKVASRIHFDGPEGIRSYSCDPKRKREQIRFIEQVMSESTVIAPHNVKEGGSQTHRDLPKLTALSSRAKLRNPLLSHENCSKQHLSPTDFALKRPFRLK